jgi:hypothetical protein
MNSITAIQDKKNFNNTQQQMVKGLHTMGVESISYTEDNAGI